MTKAPTGKWQLFIFVTLTIIALDHLTKLWITQNVAYGDGFAVIPGFFDIVHWRNNGAAFGFLNGWDSPLRNIFFYAMGGVAFFTILYFYATQPRGDVVSRLSFALIAGGAVGNLSDRFFRGSVVDFVSVHYQQKIWDLAIFGRAFHIPLSWPAFNVADSAISIAIVLLLFRSFIKPYQKNEKSL